MKHEQKGASRLTPRSPALNQEKSQKRKKRDLLKCVTRFFWNHTLSPHSRDPQSTCLGEGANGKDSRQGIALPLSGTQRRGPQSSHPGRGTKGTHAGNQVPRARQQSPRLGLAWAQPLSGDSTLAEEGGTNE